MLRRLQIGLALTGAAVALVAPSAASASAECDLVAAPNGSDSALGTLAAPLGSAGSAVAALTGGQTLCFRAGSYVFDRLSVRTPGVTLTSYPGERATLRGQLRIERPASGAVVENLTLEGQNPQNLFSPFILADRVVLRGNEITNANTSACVHLTPYYNDPPPSDVVIEGNEIHDCGRLPATNHDHGIYVAGSRNLIIRDNLIYDNADRGIQLYPDAQGTRIEGNVIDGNGQGIIFSGTGGVSANDTIVTHNIITNSRIRHNVESYYPSGTAPGRNNVVRENCIFNAPGWYDQDDGSGIASPEVGFEAHANVIADPQYVDRGAGNFELAPGSPCAGILEGADVQPGPAEGGRQDATPGEGDEPEGRPEVGQLSLQAAEPTVRPGQKTLLRGKAPASLTGKVWIYKQHHGSWKRLSLASASGSHFSIKVQIRDRGKFKASAVGARDSKTVRVTARDAKR